MILSPCCILNTRRTLRLNQIKEECKMFQAESYIQNIQESERGAARLEIMNTAITAADAEDAHYWRIYFRYEYIRESIFHDDNFKAIIMFPTLLQVFDEHPELQDDTYDDVMQAFKWVLENMPDYYQITREEIEKYYDEYEKRCREFGFSQRVYYMKKSKFYIPIDINAAKSAYQAFHDYRRDANSDCEACEINYDMTFALEMGNEAEALRIAAPILEGRKRCGEVPHVTYGALTKFYLYQGNLDEAEYYGKLCERYTCNEPTFLAETGYLLELYSAVHPTSGWMIFKRNIENFVHSKNPMMRMTFARGAYRLMQRISEETEYVGSIFLKALPVEPERTDDNDYRYSTKKLAEYFYDFTKKQSMLLDQRNSSNYYMNMLETKLKSIEAQEHIEESKAASVHGLTARVSACLAAVPASEEALPPPEILEQRLSGLSDAIELITVRAEENQLYIPLRFEGKIYEVTLLWLEVNEPIRMRPYYGVVEETYAAMLSARKHLLLQMDYSDDAMLSCHLAMHILHTLLPDMLGVIDILAQKAYPANWAAFAGSYRNAITPSDLFSLYIAGTEGSDEVWMTTCGLCTLGLRELEIQGATRENFGYFADILHYAASRCAEDSMLPDAGENFAELQVNGESCLLGWENTAEKADRPFPSGVLKILTADPVHPLPTAYPPMVQNEEVKFPSSHEDFVRRIYLAKETLPQLKRAYKSLSISLPLEQAAVRLEFTISAEMRDKCGYSKELLWAEISSFDNDTLTAQIIQTSDMLPEIKEGDEITVSEENITAWLIRPAGGDGVFTEEDTYFFM